MNTRRTDMNICTDTRTPTRAGSARAGTTAPARTTTPVRTTTPASGTTPTAQGEATPGNRGPIRQAVDEYLSPPGGGDILRLHVPGHKGGTGAPPPLRSRWGEALFRDDLTEVPGLDDLSSPAGPIAESQRLTARAFGARDAYYLVQGTTGGLVALLLAAARASGAAAFVVPRFCHRALVSASILAGLEPLFCRSVIAGGLPAGPHLDHLRDLVQSHHGGLAAVVDTYPSTYGTAHGLAAVAEIAHAAGLPLLVDGAHASLFGLAPGMPPAPLAEGADAVVLSAHKSLGSLGQSSILLLRDSPWAPHAADVSAALRVATTTSPSYPMLLSLETAVLHRLSPAGRAELERAVDFAGQLRGRLHDAGISLLAPGDGAVAADPLRLNMDAWPLGLTGTELAAWLREQANVQVEAADWRSVLAILGPGDTAASGEHLLEALARARAHASRDAGPPGAAAVWTRQLGILSETCRLRMSPRKAWFGRRSRVPLADAAGQIAAAPLAPYPPGVAAVWPGEVITPTAVEVLRAVLAGGGSIHGVGEADWWVEVSEEEET